MPGTSGRICGVYAKSPQGSKSLCWERGQHRATQRSEGLPQAVTMQSGDTQVPEVKEKTTVPQEAELA